MLLAKPYPGYLTSNSCISSSRITLAIIEAAEKAEAKAAKKVEAPAEEETEGDAEAVEASAEDAPTEEKAEEEEKDA